MGKLLHPGVTFLVVTVFLASCATNRPSGLVGTWLPQGAFASYGLRLEADGSGSLVSREMIERYPDSSGPRLEWSTQGESLFLRIGDEEGSLISVRPIEYKLQAGTLRLARSTGMLGNGIYDRYDTEKAETGTALPRCSSERA